MKKIILPVLVVAVAACNTNEGTSKLTDTTHSKYHIGDEYSFKSRSFEPNAKLTVVKVEQQDGKENIVHVSIAGVKIKVSDSPLNYSAIVTHMPFSEAALDSSNLIKLGEAKATPDYQEGYTEWRTAFAEGKAGVFSIPVGKAVEYMEETALTGSKVK